eukprot:GFYU01019761.1.p1 GENE.GFYU01019761.1~~GFYU01019761.1.p1  ORF type:complete len:286 (+),score=53.59 GFYU01019761.1:94-951(+)
MAGNRDETRRSLRRSMRELHNRSREEKHLLRDPTKALLGERILEANHLFKQAPTAQDAAVESSHVRELSIYGKEQADNLAVGKGITVEQLIHKLKESFKSNRTGMKWTELGKKADANLNTSKITEFMYGPLTLEQKVRTVGKRLKMTFDDKEASQVQTLDAGKMKEARSQATENTRMPKAKKLLAKVAPIDYFKFVINPQSFSATIENVFVFAFLVKEGNAALSVDPKTGRLIADYKEATKAGEASQKSSHMANQAVMSFTHAQYSELIDLLGLRGQAPVLPSLN